MNKTGARGSIRWAASITIGFICALLVLAMAATTARAALPADDSEAWRLRKEAGKIRIYTTDQVDSSFQAFKAEAVLNVPIEAVMAVMSNPKSCVEWVLNCSESYGVGGNDFTDRYAYSVNDMPWPVTDRDYVLHIRTRGNKTSGEIVMEMIATPGKRAENSSRVRVDRSDTLYRFTPEDGKTRMTWLQHTDPNGALPGWLVNTLLVDIPISSMEELERIAGQERYQGFQLIYNQDGQLTGIKNPTDI